MNNARPTPLSDGVFFVTHPNSPDWGDKCRNETDNFLHQRRYDPQYCYELFVRAFRHGDDYAFGQLQSVYKGLIIHWAKRHSLFSAVHAHRDSIAHYTFIKMWRSTHGERFTFDSLPAILGYLRDCINAALFELYRDFIATPKEPPVVTDLMIEPELEGSPDFELLWQRICVLLPEADLQHVVWFSFVHGYTPEALMEEFSDLYPRKDVVRVLKQKAVRRLRKDPIIRRWFGLPPHDI